MADPPPRFTTRHLFEQLNGQRYDSYPDLESAVRRVFVRHLGDFPPHYDVRDAIALAERRGWLAPEASGVAVRVDRVPA